MSAGKFYPIEGEYAQLTTGIEKAIVAFQQDEGTLPNVGYVHKDLDYTCPRETNGVPIKRLSGTVMPNRIWLRVELISD